MTIKRKATKTPVIIQSDIEDMIGNVINRGGKTATDDPIDTPVKQEIKEEEIRFTLRIEEGLIKKIDQSRKLRVGNISRNQWIIEVISSALEDKKIDCD
jgi:hypothetical protein